MIIKPFSFTSPAQHRQVLLICVAGPSDVGKTKLAEELTTELASPAKPVCPSPRARFVVQGRAINGWAVDGRADVVGRQCNGSECQSSD